MCRGGPTGAIPAPGANPPKLAEATHMRASGEGGGGRGLQPLARQLTPSASWRPIVSFPDRNVCIRHVHARLCARRRCCVDAVSRSLSCGWSPRPIRSRRRDTSATSRKARCSGTRGSTASSAVRRRLAARGCSTSPTSASRRTPTPRSSTDDEAVLSRDNLKIAFQRAHGLAHRRSQGAALHRPLQHDGVDAIRSRRTRMRS